MSYRTLNLTEERYKQRMDELRVSETKLVEQLRLLEEKKAGVERELSATRGALQVLHEMTEEASR